MRVVESGRWWRGGKGEGPAQTELFEQAFARFQDAAHGVAVNSCTSGLLCALLVADVQPGDEVILPPCTFPSPAMAVLECGATPVFADVKLEDCTLDPAAAEAAITTRTKAIVGVDYGGHPCDMDVLPDIARRHGLYLISDCAHAHGSQWRGRGVGALGHLGVFSFQGSKQLPCGEGGMVLTDDAELAAMAFSHQHAGRVPAGAALPRPIVAANLRMTEWQAAIGLVQLSRLTEQVRQREANALYLAALLAEIPLMGNIVRDARVTRQGFYFWSFKYLGEKETGVSRDTFLQALQAEGVPCFAGQTRPLYKAPLFAAAAGKYAPLCPHAEQAAAESMAISHPVFLGPQSDMDMIATAVRKVIDNITELRDRR